MNGLEMGTAKASSRPLQLTIADWSELKIVSKSILTKTAG